jgi:hypothetical protein
MICYLDRSFCVSEGCTNKCGRKLTPEIIKAAHEWWGSEEAPICTGTFCEREEAALPPEPHNGIVSEPVGVVEDE